MNVSADGIHGDEVSESGSGSASAPVSTPSLEQPRTRNSFDDALGPEYLTAYLAEYQTLRAEIKDRSDFQHRLIQIHVAAITLLLATALSDSISRWVILIIPFEAAIFGMWWLDHAITIRIIGRYLAGTVEPNIDRLFADTDVISWERGHRRSDPAALEGTLHGFRSMSNWTFFWPAILVLILCFVGAIVTSGVSPDGKVFDHLEDGYEQFFPLASDIVRAKSWILFTAFFAGCLLLWRYQRLYRQYWALMRQQHRDQRVQDAVLNKND